MSTMKSSYYVLQILFSISIVVAITTDDVNVENVIKEVKDLDIEKHPDVAEWMKECEETVGREDWRLIKSIPARLYPCIKRYINREILAEEIEDSIPRGELDLVFKKYCGRKEKVLNCIHEPLEMVKPCLNTSDLGSLNTTEEAIDAGVEFICSENGDKIALFLAEDGMECVRNHSEALKECFHHSFPNVNVSKENFMSTRFDKLLISEDNCRNVSEAHKCIVDVTSLCDDPTPSNLLDSLLTQALKVTPCKVETSGASVFSLYNYFLTFILSLVTAFYFHS